MTFDTELRAIFGGVLVLLALASIVGRVLGARATSDGARRTIENLTARVRAWWVMVGFLFVACWVGRHGAIILFALLSFLALREFITLQPTQLGDHGGLLWSFFLVLPIQYALVWMSWYGLFSVFVPVYAFVLLPMRIAIAGDNTRFLARSAKIQWGVLVCIYFVSHVPMLLEIPISGYTGENMKLVIFFVFVVQMSDVLQYVWGKTLGRRPIVPKVSPNKTFEGFVLGVLSASLLGMGLWWATPFSPLGAFAMGLVAALLGFGGGLVMSAIKRDLGVKDWGTLIEGHGGVLDRIDSLAFAAPVFFHLTRFYVGLPILPAPPQWIDGMLRGGG